MRRPEPDGPVRDDRSLPRWRTHTAAMACGPVEVLSLAREEED
jgi:hypothetical protein